jgi:Domain of unknown function DUF29
MTTLYDNDFYSWALESARALREGRFAELDIEHIAEELEGMGKERKRALQSQLARLLAHLLKWSQQPESRAWCGNSWRASIRDARREIEEILEENPGLKPHLPELFGKAYPKGVNRAIADTNLPESRFPAGCPWSLEQVMDPGFWP